MQTHENNLLTVIPAQVSPTVIPAVSTLHSASRVANCLLLVQAGIQSMKNAYYLKSLDSRLRGNDGILNATSSNICLRGNDSNLNSISPSTHHSVISNSESWNEMHNQRSDKPTRTDLPRMILAIMLLTLISTLTPPAHAAVAGRVLVSVGDSVAVRDGREVRLRFGSKIEDRDTLRTSAAGTLQVRFTDQSIVALREKSTFKLEQYAFSNQTGGKEDSGTQKAVFSLIKGGFRTITGLIGKTNRKNYSVRTAAATIGIRGTHYAVRVCEGDCKNLDGSNAKDGVYGSVLSASDKESRIVINNDAGEKEFGRDQHFYVKDEKAAPAELLVPPSFVADNLKGRGKADEKDKEGDNQAKEDANQEKGREAGEDQGSDQAKGGADGDARPNLVTSAINSYVKMFDAGCITGDCRNMLPTELEKSSVVLTRKAGVVGGFITGGVGFAALVKAAFSPSDEIVLDKDGNLVRVTAKGITGSLHVIDIGSADNVRAGRYLEAGNLAWGAWVGTGITDNVADNNIFLLKPLDSFVYIHGDAPPTLPNNIIASYKLIGGVAVDILGNLGSTTDGSVSVDFLARTVSLNSLSVDMGNRNFTLASPLVAQIGSSGLNDYINHPTGGVSNCLGSGCLATQYSLIYTGMFTGASAQGLGLNYYLDNGPLPTDQILGVGAFIRSDATLFRPIVNASSLGTMGGLATLQTSGTGASQKLLSYDNSHPLFGLNLANGVEINPLVTNPPAVTTDMIGGLPAINAHWGRWVNGALATEVLVTPGTGVHYVYGFDLTTPFVVAAQSGIFNFTHVGGTTPTDNAGNIASASSFGSMFVNFQTNDGVMSPMSWTIAGVTHDINSVDITLSPNATLRNVTIDGSSADGTCSGGICDTANSRVVSTQVTGALAGNGGNYAALAISTNSVAGNTASAQVYQCANCGSTAGIVPAGAVVAYAGGSGLTTYANTENPIFILPATERTLDTAGNLIAYDTIFGDSASHLNVANVSTLTDNIVFNGTTGPAGDGYGRWNGGSITDFITNPAGVTLTPASGIHVAYSAALTLPEVIQAKTGTINFNHAGGTNPTDHLGIAGTFNSGNLNVNFTNPAASTMDADWSVGGVGYTLTNAPLTLFVDGAGASIGATLLNDASATCTACSVIVNTATAAIDQVQINGVFSGTAGNTINMAISTFDAGLSVIPVTSASVQVFQEVVPLTNLTTQ